MAEVNAGRVMILPLGNYNSATPYHVLDLVYYNGSSWLCRQECTGVTPTDSATAYWQKFGAAVSVATITTAGIVRPDGATVLVAADGTISIPAAELNKLGIVKPDGTTIVVDANGTLSAQVAGALSALTDVNISQATQGQILQYDVTTQKWKNVSKTWLTELEQMEDVDIDQSTLANGQALIYNATSGKWENAAISQYPKLDTAEQVMANTQSGKVADALAIKAMNTAAVKKFSDSTYVTVDSIAYDEVNQVLGLKVDGADTVIPFKKGGFKSIELTSYSWAWYNASIGYIVTRGMKINIDDSTSLTFNAFALTPSGQATIFTSPYFSVFMTTTYIRIDAITDIYIDGVLLQAGQSQVVSSATATITI